MDRCFALSVYRMFSSALSAIKDKPKENKKHNYKYSLIRSGIWILTYLIGKHITNSKSRWEIIIRVKHENSTIKK